VLKPRKAYGTKRGETLKRSPCVRWTARTAYATEIERDIPKGRFIVLIGRACRSDGAHRWKYLCTYVCIYYTAADRLNSDACSIVVKVTRNVNVSFHRQRSSVSDPGRLSARG